jgi:hypothetical protein
MDAQTCYSKHFDVLAFLSEVVLPNLARWGRKIKVELVDSEEPERAWVDFGTDTLFIRRDTRIAAERGDPMARVVIAHEIGHLVLHRDQKFAFTQPHVYSTLEQGQSAEHQANWFAWSLLLPDALLIDLRRTLSPSSIATLTLVPERLVERRLHLLDLDKRYRHDNTGDECPRCGELSVKIISSTLTCVGCGLAIATI